MIALKHDIFFQKSVLNLVMLDQDIFSNTLDGIDFSVDPVFCEENFTKGSSADNHHEIKIFEADIYSIILNSSFNQISLP